MPHPRQRETTCRSPSADAKGRHCSGSVAAARLAVPAAHAMQDAAPGTDCHVPAAQAVHDVAPVAFCVERPAAHATQASPVVAAGVAATLPAPHATQEAAPVAFCHVPAAQSVHLLLPRALAKRPAAHGEHVAAATLVWAAGPARPAGHGVPEHGAAPVAEKVPGPHAMIAYSASKPVCCSEPSDVKRTSMARAVDVSAAGTTKPENWPKDAADVLEPS